MSKQKHSIDPAKRRFLTEHELAQRWSVSAKQLQKLRTTGGGCPFHKLNGAIRYRLRDIKQYEQNARRLHTSDEGPVKS
ncbi:hypothetical protein Sphch_2596 [Sphingobium chlorophenolicum L-1]|uniref:Helix-turn-helix domain-containing protein n=1 Tax=Sphingobium chlorophenolicum L-1 TaxID=690566 RepID=F6EZQ7_SPHCR|nr:hypothetical protein Sphch_2596 [Sphingobium chlorophenolicum L-1]